MDSDFGDDVRVEPVAEIDRVDVVAIGKQSAPGHQPRAIFQGGAPYHSKSLYMMVKKT